MTEWAPLIKEVGIPAAIAFGLIWTFAKVLWPFIQTQVEQRTADARLSQDRQHEAQKAFMVALHELEEGARRREEMTKQGFERIIERLEKRT